MTNSIATWNEVVKAEDLLCELRSKRKTAKIKEAIVQAHTALRNAEYAHTMALETA